MTPSGCCCASLRSTSGAHLPNCVWRNSTRPSSSRSFDTSNETEQTRHEHETPGSARCTPSFDSWQLANRHLLCTVSAFLQFRRSVTQRRTRWSFSTRKRRLLSWRLLTQAHGSGAGIGRSYSSPFKPACATARSLRSFGARTLSWALVPTFVASAKVEKRDAHRYVRTSRQSSKTGCRTSTQSLAIPSSPARAADISAPMHFSGSCRAMLPPHGKPAPRSYQSR